MNEKRDLVTAGANATPGVVMWGLTLNEMIGYATLVFIVVQMLYLLRKWYREESSLLRKLRRRAPGQDTGHGELP